MKYLILLLLAPFFSSYAQQKDCTKFKTGTFKYVDSEYLGHLIVRNDSIQIETNKNNDIQIITSVDWISNCKYILTYKDVINFDKKEDVIGKKIIVEIIDYDNEKYTCKAISDVMNSTMEMVKIN